MRGLVRNIAVAMLAVSVACSDEAPEETTVASIRFAALPQTIVAGEPFTITVEVVAPGGSLARGATDAVAITSVGGATLTGPTSVAARDGKATFKDVAVTKTGPVQLVATLGNFTVTAIPVDVAAGPPSPSQSTITPVTGNILPNASTNLVLTLKDGFGNLLQNVPVSLSTNMSAATLSPASGFTTADGTFATTLRSTAEGTIALTVTANGESVALPTSFVVVDPCPATPLTVPGNGSGTLTTNGCTVDGRPTSPYRFTMNNESVVKFTMNTASFGALFEVTANVAAENVKVFAAQTPASAEWLLPAGTYQFKVGSLGPTGAFTFTSSAGATVGCSQRILAVAGVYTSQSLATTDCDYTDGTFFDSFLVFDSRPCVITMHSTVVEPYMELYDATLDPADRPLLAAAKGNFVTDARIPRSACRTATGPLELWVNSFVPGTGPYVLTVTIAGTPTLAASSAVITAPLMQRMPRVTRPTGKTR